jgi:hypothetical protein
MVQKPENADVYNWDAFIQFCKREGIEVDHWEDVEAWWKCYKTGYCVAMNEPR